MLWAPAGAGDDVLASGGDDGCRVELAFGDDALRGAEDAVHVEGMSSAPFTMKCFRALQVAVLTIVLFSVVEAVEILLLVAFGTVSSVMRRVRSSSCGRQRAVVQ